ncbi:hypothetical protein N9R28_01245 [Flavobacteriaceae bacterium]|nr:hypothetical protein [Flavobacteriaceae bacterium]MDB4097368.1 hypothetical protein [Flavobacteriaceae bacterium]
MNVFFENISVHNKLIELGLDSEQMDDEFMLTIDDENEKFNEVIKLFKSSDCIVSLYNAIENYYGELGEEPNPSKQDEILNQIELS